MADKEKENWLVQTLTFIFSWFKTGNDRVDTGVVVFTKIILAVCLILTLLAILILMMDSTLPVIGEGVGDGLKVIFGSIIDLFSSNNTIPDQIPPPAGGAVPSGDIPVI